MLTRPRPRGRPRHRWVWPRRCLRIAAAGDIHCAEDREQEITRAVGALRGAADLVLLAGDLTTHGEPAQAAVLANACAGLQIPVLAVLGNHDWHANRADELIAVLSESGIRVLERSTCVLEIDGVKVGVAGVKGFVGGFAGSHLPDFGEPLLRDVYAETSRDAEARPRAARDRPVPDQDRAAALRSDRRHDRR